MKSILGDRKAIMLLLTPALVVYTLIILVPVVWSFVLTFFDGSALGGFQFAGVSNFERLFTDPYIADAFWFTVKYAVLVTLFQVVFGYGLALLYNFVLRKSSVLVRTLVFFPVVLPTVAVSLLYQKLFQSAPNDGLVNELLVNVGLSGVDWLGSGTTAFVVIVIMDVWRSMGFYGVLVFSGLLDIPDEIIESARIDGARGFGLFRFIVLPMSLPILYASFIFSINGTIKVFDSVYALTLGGPGSSTTPLTLYMYRTAFQYSDYGYGSTIALLLTVMCLAVTLLIFRSSRRDNTI
ncbi:multiple sugar transport system permease protein/raffinose/stachyose/melibiose transport system permease protein [Microbacterium halimionae]|uniref:Multiple sugar transport system permease protein/raffinose/stachyose/melibiose transport system permease protein n=1 Tax=Microbacterium halimionae TaxID=1526413 RepID=A0A7W3PK48_9MICO|nr:sugar ABC transporter permease [Microbacterium halimionae]MBA8815160.1 multiple sugar transport system permease protein/raffinose/stachyose/melibiose transport system permease protein [Microbacterium halimionae]NII94049.1 multiple sugar transport system permease protein/raffinose/stachyose/melibiose transport system permease protein [Microbacterium halimionae]